MPDDTRNSKGFRGLMEHVALMRVSGDDIG
jgi:hypothetical protein